MNLLISCNTLRSNILIDGNTKQFSPILLSYVFWIASTMEALFSFFPTKVIYCISSIKYSCALNIAEASLFASFVCHVNLTSKLLITTCIPCYVNILIELLKFVLLYVQLLSYTRSLIPLVRNRAKVVFSSWFWFSTFWFCMLQSDIISSS